MALLTAKRFNPLLHQPAITQESVKDPVALYKILLAQQKTIKSLTTSVANAINPLSGAGPLANRPPAGSAGRIYYATDVSHFYDDDGTDWIQVV